MDKKTLTQKIKDKALALGYAKVGITSVDEFTQYLDTVEERLPNYTFIAKNPKGPVIGARPKDTMPEARSIICTSYDYSNITYPEKLKSGIGRIYLSRTYTPPAGTLEHS